MMASRKIWGITAVSAMLLGFCLLYLVNLNGWLLPDDEGTDFYEVWMLSQGFQPGQDFIAEQQPLFLLLGQALLSLDQSPPFLLRLAATIQVLAGAFLLGWGVWRLFGGITAVYMLLMLLTSGQLYEQARLFRPDPMMLAWEMGGLTAVFLAVRTGKRRWWVVAGVGYGTAVLWKLFGLFPVAGLILYFLWRFGRERTKWHTILGDGLAFALPFLAVAGGVSLALYGRLGFYYGEAFGYHLQMGQDQGLFTQIMIIGRGFLYMLLINPIFLFLVPLLWLNRAKRGKLRPEEMMLWLQLLSPFIFLFFRRQMHIRYFLHLIPVLSILLARQLTIGLHERQNDGRMRVAMMGGTAVFIFAFALFTTKPAISQLLLRQETATRELAELVTEQTTPGDLVLSDYAGINFFAGRRSIYEASIIAGGQIDSGIVTGELLIARMETEPIKMVLLHVSGGDPPAHQLVKLQDYDQFRTYLTTHFRRLRLFDRAGQQIEVYQRD